LKVKEKSAAAKILKFLISRYKKKFVQKGVAFMSHKIVFEVPENCTTAWEIQRDYGISKQKVVRTIHSGKLNGVKIQNGKWVLQKWYIPRNELFQKFIDDQKTKENSPQKSDNPILKFP